MAHVDIDSKGFAWIPEDDFLGHFAADIDPVKAKVMYAVQQPLHTSTFDDVMGTPAWRSLPSWYLVAENDEVIPPDAERQFAQRMGADTIEVASRHCAMVSHPEETHERIVTAANAVAVPGQGQGPTSSGASRSPWMDDVLAIWSGTPRGSALVRTSAWPRRWETGRSASTTPGIEAPPPVPSRRRRDRFPWGEVNHRVPQLYRDDPAHLHLGAWQ